MEKTNLPSGCARWQPAFEDLLHAVEGSGTTHGHLIDIREALKGRVESDRPLVMLCPHADDGAITAAALLHEYAVRRGLPVIEVLVFTGERNVDAPWLNQKKRISVRESEFRLECQVLGAEAVCWELDAYRSPGYQPSAARHRQDRRLVPRPQTRRHHPAAGHRRPPGPPHDPRPGRHRPARRQAGRHPGPDRLDPLGPAAPAQRLSSPTTPRPSAPRSGPSTATPRRSF